MTMLIIMYIPIIIISSAIDIPEANPIIDDEGAVNEGVGDEEEVLNEEVTDDKVKNEEDMDEDEEVRNDNVMDEAIGDEGGVMK